LDSCKGDPRRREAEATGCSYVAAASLDPQESCGFPSASEALSQVQSYSGYIAYFIFQFMIFPCPNTSWYEYEHDLRFVIACKEKWDPLVSLYETKILA
jgi:hypothetical protein